MLKLQFFMLPWQATRNDNKCIINWRAKRTYVPSHLNFLLMFIFFIGFLWDGHCTYRDVLKWFIKLLLGFRVRKIELLVFACQLCVAFVYVWVRVSFLFFGKKFAFKKSSASVLYLLYGGRLTNCLLLHIPVPSCQPHEHGTGYEVVFENEPLLKVKS